MAPSWALFLGDLGKFLIFAAFALFIVTFLGQVLTGKYPKLELPTRVSFVLGGFCLFATICSLALLFVNNQFEFGYVFAHSEATILPKYKVAGIWAGQEGSFLLWSCTSAMFGIIAARYSGIYRRWFTAVYSVFLGTLCGILAYETPFGLSLINGKPLVPPTGAGLQPSLENYWVVIHPPTIFTGFGSLTVAAAFGLAAMLSGNVTDWVAKLRPFAIFSTAILGLGLCFGGFWAYETLGWGGFWAWDPVENVSFVPWVLSIGLLHGIIVQTNRKKWFGANLLLAGLPFLIFCYGTFLTRSGFLANASVHSFVEMNHNALWILIGFTSLAVITYVSMWATRGRKLAREQEPPSPPTSGLDREKLYASGVVMLSALAITTAIGMSVPFFLAVANKPSKVVEAALYHKVVVWFFVPIMIFMAVAPFTSWRKMAPRELFARITYVMAITIGLLGFWMALAPAEFMVAPGSTISFPFHLAVPLFPWITFLAGTCLLAVVGNLWRLIETVRRSPMSVGGFVAHIGAALLMGGLIVSLGLQQQQQIFLQEGDTVKAFGYSIQYAGMTEDQEGGLFKHDNKVLFTLKDASGVTETVRPGLYYIQQQDGTLSPMVWPAILHSLSHDLYFSLHAPELDVWKDPVSFQPGETLDPNGQDIFVTYKGMRMVGPGGIGTQFIADCIVRVKNPDGTISTHVVHPAVAVTAQGVQPTLSTIDDNFSISLESIDASTNDAQLQVHFNKAIYPIDIYYKPLVWLVWLGAATMAIGGFIAAYYRRTVTPMRRKVIYEPILEGEETPTPENYATVSDSQS